MVKVNDTIDRIKTILNIRKDTELAKHLGRSPNNIYTWRERDTMDWRFLIDFFWDNDLNYIFKGENKDRSIDSRVRDHQIDYKSYADSQKIIEKQQIQIETLENIILKLKYDPK